MSVRDDLVTPGEEVRLRFPTGDISGKFVAQHQRVAFPGHLVVDVDSVGRESGHDLDSIAFLRRIIGAPGKHVNLEVATSRQTG